MLTIKYKSKSQVITTIDSNSSAFASCITTLANSVMGLRPNIPFASGTADLTQLLIARVYAFGIGVNREIVCLPAPRILRIYNIHTGELAYVKKLPEVTLALDQATVIVKTIMGFAEEELELVQEHSLDISSNHLVRVRIYLRPLNELSKPSQIRLEYGIDSTAANAYLGAIKRLTVHHYKIAECLAHTDSLSARVTTEENSLVYEINMASTPQSSKCINIRSIEKNSHWIAAHTDFKETGSQQFDISWSISKKAAIPNTTINRKQFKLTAHSAFWRSIWKKYDIAINTNDHMADLGIKYAIFQLIQTSIGHSPSDLGTISPARGLSSSYHSGATFFDTELHKCIFWSWNEPSMAKAMLDYRYRCLEPAIAFANSTNFNGARFPEASNDLGTENGPHYVIDYPCIKPKREWSVTEVLHISADVCYALNQYWKITGDEQYIRTRGAEIITKCAEFAASVFKWCSKKQQYVINAVMGPDEYHYHVNNSFFTNYMLRWTLQHAIELNEMGILPRCSQEEIKKWKAIAKNVFLPWIDVNNTLIPEQFEGYSKLRDIELRDHSISGPRFNNALEKTLSEDLANFPSKLIKQADIILLMSLFPDEFSEDIKRESLRFYGPRTAHDSSLSYGPHAVIAAHTGYTSEAASYILQGSRYNLDFTNKSDYENGLHLSAYAGAWQGLVEGMAGLRIKNGTISFFPRLPMEWRSYKFTIQFRGKQLTVKIKKDRHVEITYKNNRLLTHMDTKGRIHLAEPL